MFNATANPLTNGYMKNPATGASHIKQAIISTNIETIVNAIEILFCFVLRISSSIVIFLTSSFVHILYRFMNDFSTIFMYYFSCCLMISANIDSSLSTWIGFAICPFIPASLFRTAFPYFLANHLALYNYSLFTNNARIAFNTARIITPTSAKNCKPHIGNSYCSKNQTNQFYANGY